MRYFWLIVVVVCVFGSARAGLCRDASLRDVLRGLKAVPLFVDVHPTTASAQFPTTNALKTQVQTELSQLGLKASADSGKPILVVDVDTEYVGSIVALMFYLSRIVTLEIDLRQRTYCYVQRWLFVSRTQRGPLSKVSGICTSSRHGMVRLLLEPKYGITLGDSHVEQLHTRPCCDETLRPDLLT